MLQTYLGVLVLREVGVGGSVGISPLARISVAVIQFFPLKSNLDFHGDKQGGGLWHSVEKQLCRSSSSVTGTMEEFAVWQCIVNVLYSYFVYQTLKNRI